MATITWNEKLSEELKGLNKLAKPSAQQKSRIATLKGIQATAKKGKTATTGTNLNTVVDKTAGTVDPQKANEAVQDAEKADQDTNFKLEHPTKITDANGNSRIVTKHSDGTVTVVDEIGGTSKKFRDLAEAAATTFNGAVDRQAAFDAEFANRTKYLDRDQAREMEEQKQELANRGIPYDPAAVQDPNTKNLYGKTIGGISQKYQGLKSDAANQATLAGNSAYATSAQARDSFINAATNGASTFGGNFGQYANSTPTDSSGDLKDILALSADAYMKRYNVDQQTYQVRLAKAKSGGTPSGGNKSPPKESGGGFRLEE